MSVGYLWERICWLSFIVPLFVTALRNPGYYGHLTYWTLALHSVYFTIDKESPQASTAIYLLQGASFVGAMAVFMGYTFISVGGMYRFGTWIEWENAVGKAAGTVTHDRSFAECAFFKSYEHLWPVFALVLDTYFSRDALKKTYAGKPPLRTMLLDIITLGSAGGASGVLHAKREGAMARVGEQVDGTRRATNGDDWVATAG